MYEIMGRSSYGTEVIDEADNLEEAEGLVAEYKMAFGAGWSIWYRRA